MTSKTAQRSLASDTLGTIKVSGETPYFHPTCRVQGATVNKVEHLKNHTQKENGTQLQIRSLPLLRECQTVA
jgi:hypothetical protein